MYLDMFWFESILFNFHSSASILFCDKIKIVINLSGRSLFAAYIRYYKKWEFRNFRIRELYSFFPSRDVLWKVSYASLSLFLQYACIFRCWLRFETDRVVSNFVRSGAWTGGDGTWVELSGKMHVLARLLAHLRQRTDDRIVLVSNYTQVINSLPPLPQWFISHLLSIT